VQRKGSSAEVFLTFLKLGLTSFGGPIAHIGYFRTEFVEQKRWVSESQFGQLLAISQFLPGPASSQLGFSIGLIRAGWLGALAAFIAFTLPSALLLIAFASSLVYLSGPTGEAAIHGLKIVALVVVAHGVIGMSRSLCPDNPRRLIAILALITLLFADVLFTGTAIAQLLVVCFGALAGIWLCQNIESNSISAKKLISENSLTLKYSVPTGYVFIGLFFALLFLLPLSTENNTSLISIANAFYNAGALVFGGGHVVLPFLEESIVGSGWVSSEQFMAGYGTSQAIPGPMFSFSAYLGAILPDSQSSSLTIILYAATALIFVFLPGFLLIVGVLPIWNKLSSKKIAVSAIAGVNAAVVGLLAATLYDPIFTAAVSSAYDLGIGIVGLVLLTVRKSSPLIIVVWCVLANIVLGILL